MKYDYLIVGAGVIGLTIALELKKRKPNLSIAILEKERDVAKHASGRNSGVLHAGFYYTDDSLKAKFTADGNRKMKLFCKEHSIKVNECKKVVIAKNREELDGIDELYRRGVANGVEVEIISEEELKKLEPNAKTYQRALLSPSTASINPIDVMLKMKELLLSLDVKIFFNRKYLKHKKDTVFTNVENFNYSYLINSAGLYADKIAHDFNIAKNYTLLPFKGLYLEYKGDKKLLNMHIYPVPDLQNPFLGVHFTKTVDGLLKIGPTSMPAFWRENYKGFKNFSFKEFFEVLFRMGKLFILNSFGFRKLAIHEMRKYKPHFMINESKTLVNNVEDNFIPKEAGIRAQLLDKSDNSLVMDFKTEQTENSLHVLNAVSPALTCSLSFAEYICDILENR